MLTSPSAYEKMSEQNYTYTIIDQKDNSEITLVINEKKTETEDYVQFQGIYMDRQQVGELGALLLALAGEFDYDSVNELLDGYQKAGNLRLNEQLYSNIRKLKEVLWLKDD